MGMDFPLGMGIPWEWDKHRVNRGGIGRDLDRNGNFGNGNNSHRFNKLFAVSEQQYAEMTTEL